MIWLSVLLSFLTFFLIIFARILDNFLNLFPIYRTIDINLCVHKFAAIYIEKCGKA